MIRLNRLEVMPSWPIQQRQQGPIAGRRASLKPGGYGCGRF